MLTSEEARGLALRLPQTVEQDHHGRPSFRVEGHIFATLWTDRAMNVMPGEEHIRWAVQEFGDRCRPVHWGRRLAAVQVDLDLADAPLLEDLLDLAWTYRALLDWRGRARSWRGSGSDGTMVPPGLPADFP